MMILNKGEKMTEKTSTKLIKNTTMLMVLNITKLILPFFSLPYLTRVLSTDAYGTVAYIKSVIGYMQVLVDFGFILSGTKDIVSNLNDKEKINYIIGDTLGARILVSIVAFFIYLLAILFIPILHENILYSFLSFIPVFLSIFLFDFVFRGIEKMHIITIRFFVMKSISTILIFITIKNDADIIRIPILDSISTLVAVVLVGFSLKKENIFLKISSFRNVLYKLKDSFLYFLSSIAAQSFNAVNTIIVGLFMSKTDIAYWSVCLQIIGAIQILYTPITDAIYPEMLRSKNFSLIKRCLSIFQPIIFIGCIAAYFLAEFGLSVVGGSKYTEATFVFRLLIPVLFFSFPGMLLGWPSLGAILKVKEVTVSTVFTIIFQVLGLFILFFTGKFSLISIAILRSVAEFVLFACRLSYCIKFRKEFC